MAEKQVISTPHAPQAIGPYSQALLVGNTLYISGQLGIDPAAGQLVSDSVEDQCRQALNNIKAILHAAQMDTSNVVQCQVFLSAQTDRFYAARSFSRRRITGFS